MISYFALEFDLSTFKAFGRQFVLLEEFRGRGKNDRR